MDASLEDELLGIAPPPEPGLKVKREATKNYDGGASVSADDKDDEDEGEDLQIRWLNVASTPPDDGAFSASLGHLKARAAPTQPGAPPEHLGGFLWPQ